MFDNQRMQEHDDRQTIIQYLIHNYLKLGIVDKNESKVLSSFMQTYTGKELAKLLIESRIIVLICDKLDHLLLFAS